MIKQSKKRSIGAPMKTAYLLDKLDDHQLYTPATVAALSLDPKNEPAQYTRAKKSLWAFAKYHNFHDFDDGHIKNFKAWKGWRWKEAVRPEDWALLRKPTLSNGPRTAPGAKSVPQSRRRFDRRFFWVLPIGVILGLLFLSTQEPQPVSTVQESSSIQDYTRARRGERLGKVAAIAQFERPPLTLFQEIAP